MNPQVRHPSLFTYSLIAALFSVGIAHGAVINSVTGGDLQGTCLVDLSTNGTDWVTFSDGIGSGSVFVGVAVTNVGSVTPVTSNGLATVCVGLVTNSITGETNVWPQTPSARVPALVDGSHTNWGLVHALAVEDGGDMDLGEGLAYTLSLPAGTYRLKTYIGGRRTEPVHELVINDGTTATFLDTIDGIQFGGSAAGTNLPPDNLGELDAEVVAEFGLSAAGTVTYKVTTESDGSGAGADWLAIRGAAIQTIPQTDTNPPVVLSVDGNAVLDLNDSVVVTFDEAVDLGSATFVLTNSLGANVALTSTNLSAGKTVLTFVTAPLTAGESYGLTLTGVRDNQPSPNVLNTTEAFVAQAVDPTVRIDWRQTLPKTTIGPSNLVYSLDASGQLTGGAGLETFSGVGALAMNFANLLTVRSYDALTFTPYSGVVVDANSNDYVEAAVSGSTWNPALGGLTQVGYTFHGSGLFPHDPFNPLNNWLYQGPLFMQLDFTAPTNAGKNMKISFTDQSTLAVYEVGDTERSDGVPADSFTWTMPPGATLSLLVWNHNVTNPGDAGNSRRLQTCTLEFVEPDTNPPVVLDVEGRILFSLDDEVLVTLDEAVDIGSATFSVTNALGTVLPINNTSLSADLKTIILSTGPMAAGTNYFLTISGVKDLAIVPNTLNTNAQFVAVDVSPIAQISWIHPGVNLQFPDPTPLVYSIDAFGSPTGGNGDETLSGAVPVQNVSNVLTVSAYDITGTSLDAVVADTNANDWLEAAVSGTGWDASLVGAANVGFGFHKSQGLTPGGNNNTWDWRGNEILVFDFNAPTNGGYSMKLTINGRGNPSKILSWVVGDTETSQGQIVGNGGDVFTDILAPGQSRSYTTWNYDESSANSRMIRYAELEFILLQPTLSISESSGTITVTWDPMTGTLQSAPTVTGPWTPVTTVSPYLTPASGSAEFYRVQVP